jgi:ribosomal protein S27E
LNQETITLTRDGRGILSTCSCGWTHRSGEGDNAGRAAVRHMRSHPAAIQVYHVRRYWLRCPRCGNEMSVLESQMYDAKCQACGRGEMYPKRVNGVDYEEVEV